MRQYAWVSLRTQMNSTFNGAGHSCWPSFHTPNISSCACRLTEWDAVPLGRAPEQPLPVTSRYTQRQCLVFGPVCYTHHPQHSCQAYACPTNLCCTYIEPMLNLCCTYIEPILNLCCTYVKSMSHLFGHARQTIHFMPVFCHPSGLAGPLALCVAY